MEEVVGVKEEEVKGAKAEEEGEGMSLQIGIDTRTATEETVMKANNNNNRNIKNKNSSTEFLSDLELEGITRREDKLKLRSQEGQGDNRVKL
jgi:hypothetical protein